VSHVSKIYEVLFAEKKIRKFQKQKVTYRNLIRHFPAVFKIKTIPIYLNE